MRWFYVVGFLGGFADIASTSSDSQGRFVAAWFVAASCFVLLLNETLSNPE